ncbi:MAG: diguanylate cyclase, partial [Hungatella sp.]
MVGLAMLLLSLVNRKSIHFQKMMLQGITALNLSVYFMCETYSVLLLFPYSKIIYYLDMLTFSMVGTCFILIFAWELSSKYKKVLYTVAWLGIINTLLQLILGLTGFIELRLTLRYTHILQAVAAVITIGCLIDEYRRTRNTKTIFCFSVIIIGGLMDMLLFTAERNRYHNVFFLNLGILVYMAQQSYLYLERFIEQIESITRENYYKNLAFQDVLTGCYSRLAYEIDKSKCPKSEVWTAFSFDINDLKKMNDLHGHAEGDRLLHTFGTLLILVFGNYGKCYRIGG